MKKGSSIAKLVARHLEPEEDEMDSITGTVTLRLSADMILKLKALASVFGVKPSPLGAEMLVEALKEAISLLPEEKMHEFAEAYAEEKEG